jgi:uncharacterized protein YacL
MQTSKSEPVVDERIESLTNRYASNAFNFLCYYLGISVVVKGFTLDVSMFIYWDNAIVMALAVIYMIYRSAEEGVPVTPTTLKPMKWTLIQGFLFIGLIMGLFITFYVAGMVEHWDTFFSSFPMKVTGATVIAVFFAVLMTFFTWLFDVIPTKRALRKAAELAEEQATELPDDDQLIKQSHIKDERIDSINDKYAARGLYVMLVYIPLSTLVKWFMLDVSMYMYYDAFLALMAACGYFIWKVIREDVFGDTPHERQSLIRTKAFQVLSFLTFGFFMSFLVFPMDEELVATLDSFTSRFILGIVIAVIFGVGCVLLMKLLDWLARKQAEKLSKSE